MRARLLLWCGDVVAGVVTARGPERMARTGECPPQGFASSFLLCHFPSCLIGVKW